MSSLVLDLQHDALDPNVRVSDMLRRALVVARKLNLTDFELWVTQELEGYPLGTAPPPYRIFEGEPRVWNPYHGWQPVVFASASQHRSFCRQPTRQPIGEIEAMAAQAAKTGGRLSSNFPPEVARQLMDASGAPSPPVLQIDSSTLLGLLDAVRNALLKWSLKLQEDGILGSDVGFSEKEKAAATATHHTVNNFFAPISGDQVQIASPGSTQLHIPHLDIGAVQALVAALDQARDNLHLAPDAQAELEADLRTLHSQLASPKPKQSIVRETLGSVRAILEGAVGGALGDAAAPLLARVLPLLQ